MWGTKQRYVSAFRCEWENDRVEEDIEKVTFVLREMILNDQCIGFPQFIINYMYIARLTTGKPWVPERGKSKDIQTEEVIF